MNERMPFSAVLEPSAVSRRELLQRSVAGAAGLFLAESMNFVRASDSPPRVHSAGRRRGEEIASRGQGPSGDSDLDVGRPVASGHFRSQTRGRLRLLGTAG